MLGRRLDVMAVVQLIKGHLVLGAHQAVTGSRCIIESVLKGMRAGIWGTSSVWGRVLTYKG